MAKELFIVHHDGGWAVKRADAERSSESPKHRRKPSSARANWSRKPCPRAESSR